jgi:hypothetical protein
LLRLLLTKSILLLQTVCVGACRCSSSCSGSFLSLCRHHAKGDGAAVRVAAAVVHPEGGEGSNLQARLLATDARAWQPPGNNAQGQRRRHCAALRLQDVALEAREGHETKQRVGASTVAFVRHGRCARHWKARLLTGTCRPRRVQRAPHKR